MSVHVQSTVVLTDSTGNKVTVAVREGWETDAEPFGFTDGASGNVVKASADDLTKLAAALTDLAG